MEVEIPDFVSRYGNSVYVNKSYFIFHGVCSVISSLQVHTMDKKTFDYNVKEETLGVFPMEQSKRFELFGMGVYKEDQTYDGKWIIHCSSCEWMPAKDALISEIYPGHGDLFKIDSIMKSFLSGKEFDFDLLS